MGSGRSLPLWAVATAETTVNRRVDCLPVLIPQAFPVLEIHVSLALWFCVSCQHTSSLLLRPTETGFHWVTWPVEYESARQCPPGSETGPSQALYNSSGSGWFVWPSWLRAWCQLSVAPLAWLLEWDRSELNLTQGLEPSQPRCSLRQSHPCQLTDP